MSDDRIARLTELARRVYPLREQLRVSWNEHTASVVEDLSGIRLIDIAGIRNVDALEAALCVLAGEVREVPTGRGPETLRLRIGYERGLKRIAELERELSEARAEIDKLTREASFP